MNSDSAIHIPLWLDLTAVFVGAVLGSMVGLRPSTRGPAIALLGVVVLATVMGLGGGLLRDILLARVPLALRSNWYLAAVAVAVALTWLIFRHLRRVNWLLEAVDALSLGLYAALGAFAAEQAGLAPLGSIVVGTFAGVGGGFLRDMLLNNVPEIMQPGRLYGVVAVFTSTVYVALTPTGLGTVARYIVALTLGVTLRALTLWRGWTLPSATPFRQPKDEAADDPG